MAKLIVGRFDNIEDVERALKALRRHSGSSRGTPLARPRGESVLRKPKTRVRWMCRS